MRTPRPHSEYQTQCQCGAVVRSLEREAVCVCGRQIRIEWPAQYKSSVERYTEGIPKGMPIVRGVK